MVTTIHNKYNWQKIINNKEKVGFGILEFGCDTICLETIILCQIFNANFSNDFDGLIVLLTVAFCTLSVAYEWYCNDVWAILIVLKKIKTSN